MNRLEAGYSMVELLIVLAIVAGLSSLAAMSLRPSDNWRPGDLRRIIAEARTAAILSGTPVPITVGVGRAQWADRDEEIAGRLLVDGRAAAAPYALLAYPDGSYSGKSLAVERDGVTTAMNGIYREGSR